MDLRRSSILPRRLFNLLIARGLRDVRYGEWRDRGGVQAQTTGREPNAPLAPEPIHDAIEEATPPAPSPMHDEPAVD
eukprot:2084921-Prymnesium_polylepis.1